MLIISRNVHFFIISSSLNLFEIKRLTLILKNGIDYLGVIIKDQNSNDQNSWNYQKSVRQTVGAATYFFKNFYKL